MFSLCSFIQRCDQYAEYDAFIWSPDPSNPWITDDVTLWEQDKSLYVCLTLLREFSFTIRNDYAPNPREDEENARRKYFSIVLTCPGSKVRTTFILYATQQTLPQERAVQLSFEWSHYSISSTDSKVRTTLYTITNSTTGRRC